jgi:uncharacterized protein (TIGR03083 family)
MSDPDNDIRTATIAERRAQARIYAELTPAQWEAPSLCAGWRVREVVAHLSMPFRSSTPRVVWELVRARGSFDRMADRRARRDAAEMSTEDLVAAVRDNATNPWTPPGGGALGALSHDVIHGLDVTTALGLDRRVPRDRLAMVLGGLTATQLASFDTDLDGIALEAVDVDWRRGEGEPVRGLVQDLLLVVCGRKLPAGRLEGAAAHRLTLA